MPIALSRLLVNFVRLQRRCNDLLCLFEMKYQAVLDFLDQCPICILQ